MINVQLKSYDLRKVTDQLVHSVIKEYPEASVKELCSKLGRSNSWFVKKARELGYELTRKQRSVEDFFTLLDNTPYNETVVVKDYAVSTVIGYVSKYSAMQVNPIKYKVTETKAGIAIKFWLRKT